MEPSQRIGLYYPYIHFQDDIWLKTAALYWPHLARVVPDFLRPNDSDTVRTLSTELNFILDVSPGSAATELSDILLEAIVDHFDEFKARFSVPSAPYQFDSNWCSPTWPEPKKTIYNWRNGGSRELALAGKVVGIHNGKGADFLWSYLSDSGLAIQRGEWYGLHPELAWLYMCALTERIAQKNKLIPITDQYLAHAESRGWTDEAFISALLGHNLQIVGADNEGSVENIGMLALKIVVPANSAQIPIKKIIDVRQRYGAEFDAFHAEVEAAAEDLQGRISGIDNESILSAYLDDEIDRRFRRPLDELGRAMRGVGIDTTFAALTNKFELPASGALLGGLLTHNPVVATGGGLAFGVGTLWRSYRRNRSEQLPPTAASYLWRIDRDINPKTLLERVRS